MVGIGLLARRHPDLVPVAQVAGPLHAHQLVAALHLAHDVGEDRRRVLHVGDDRREQVRDALVVVELDLLGVDQDHPQVVRRRAQQHRGEEGVEAHALAGAGGSGDQEVGHPGQVDVDRLAAEVQAEPRHQRAGVRRELAGDVAERDQRRLGVRHLHADGLLARDRRDDAQLLARGEGVGEVVAQRGDAADLGAGGQLQLVAGDARAADRVGDLGLDAEVPERLLQEACWCAGSAPRAGWWGRSSAAGARPRGAGTPRSARARARRGPARRPPPGPGPRRPGRAGRRVRAPRPARGPPPRRPRRGPARARRRRRRRWARGPARAACPRAPRRGRGRCRRRPRARAEGAADGRRRPIRVGGSMASSRSRSFWLLRMAVTEAVATPRPTVLEATAAPSPLRRTARPSEAPEIRTDRRDEARRRRAGPCRSRRSCCWWPSSPPRRGSRRGR